VRGEDANPSDDIRDGYGDNAGSRSHARRHEAAHSGGACLTPGRAAVVGQQGGARKSPPARPYRPLPALSLAGYRGVARASAAGLMTQPPAAIKCRAPIGSVPGAGTPETLGTSAERRLEAPLGPLHQEEWSRCKLTERTRMSTCRCRRPIRASRARSPFGSCAIAFGRGSSPGRCLAPRGRRRGGRRTDI
jgi:hypothetical protein